jgi:hypothetical protein
MKFIIVTLMAAISSTSTMAFVISNGFLNGGLLKTNGFVNGFDNGLVKTNGFVNGFDNGLIKTNGFVNGFDSGLVKTTGFVNGFDNGLINNGLSVARINSVQTNFPNKVVATVENIAALPVAPLPVATLPIASSFATIDNFATKKVFH